MSESTANAVVQDVPGIPSEAQRQSLLRELWQALGALIQLVSSRYEQRLTLEEIHELDRLDKRVCTLMRAVGMDLPRLPGLIDPLRPYGLTGVPVYFPWLVAHRFGAGALVPSGGADRQWEAAWQAVRDAVGIRLAAMEAPQPAATPNQRSAGEGQAAETRSRKAQRHRMSVEEANAEAMKLARRMRQAFFALSERQQAAQIGCSWKTWTRTRFYTTAQAKRPGGKRSRPASPKVESLTPALERVTGEGERDEVLQKLTAEHKADNEPSPLESDPPSRPRTIHCHKRL
jgi:hypothetical protein